MKGYVRQAKQLRALAHPVRLKLLEVLRQQPACVCELITLTHQRQPYISQQLSVLRRAGLVKWEKQGQLVQYRLAGSEVSRLIDDLRTMISDPAEERLVLPDEGVAPRSARPLANTQTRGETVGLLAQGNSKRT